VLVLLERNGRQGGQDPPITNAKIDICCTAGSSMQVVDVTLCLVPVEDPV